MTTVYLSLGSNLGDRRGYLERALEALRDEFKEVRSSRIYETEPVELLDQPWFLNLVTEFKTEWRPEFLLEWVQRLERDLGRQRGVPKGPRTLDADILLFGSETRKSADLVIPHPAMLDRRHVLRRICCVDFDPPVSETLVITLRPKQKRSCI